MPLEKGKLTLNDLAPRIQTLRHQDDQLQAARLELDELLTARRIWLADEKVARSYVEDLREVPVNCPLLEQKAFIRNLVKEVRVTCKDVLLTYAIPLPPEGLIQETAAVLDTVHNGEPW